MAHAVRRQYRAYAGFVTTPQFFDDSPTQFLKVAPPGTGVIQRVNHIDDYEFTLSERDRNFGVLEEAAICLGRSHCQVIGQVGTNWVHCTGTSPDAIVQTGAGMRMVRVLDMVEAQTGKPLVASDGALYWAMLRHLGLAAAPGYGHLLATLR